MTIDTHTPSDRGIEVGDRVQIKKGLAECQSATVEWVYMRWAGPDAYCTVRADSGEFHFEKANNLEHIPHDD